MRSLWPWRLSLICAGALLTTPAPAAAEGLIPDLRQRLEQDGFCIGGRTDLGMAGPYLGRESPVFITTDSVLALFHGFGTFHGPAFHIHHKSVVAPYPAQVTPNFIPARFV